MQKDLQEGVEKAIDKFYEAGSITPFVTKDDFILSIIGATVVGVSKDDLKSHDKLRSKFNLKFLLLSDPDSEMIKKYEAYGKKMTGFGTIRSTYIIGKDGVILKAYPKVKPLVHTDEVIEYLKGLKNWKDNNQIFLYFYLI